MGAEVNNQATHRSSFDPESSDYINGPTMNPGHRHNTSTTGANASSQPATVSTPTFVSGTAKVVNAQYDTILYVNVTTAAALAIAIGPTSSPANTIVASETVALGLLTLRIPAGWYVKITGTIADLTITAITC